MAMEISRNYSNYNNMAYNFNENEQMDKTKTEKIKNSKDRVEEYYQKLCKKFPGISFNTSGGEQRCNSNKVVVNLSYECLRKMANDPEFAKEIEYNLSGEVQANAMTYGWAKRDGVELGGRTVSYDANGNRTSSCGGMRTANARNSSSKVQGKSDTLEDRIKKKREEKEEMEALLNEKYRKKEELKERLEERRRDREAYLEQYIDGNSNMKQYKSIENIQSQSYFDTNA